MVTVATRKFVTGYCHSEEFLANQGRLSGHVPNGGPIGWWPRILLAIIRVLSKSFVLISRKR